MDAPIFPTTKTDETWVATDLKVADSPVVLRAGREYKIDHGAVALLSRPVDSDASWEHETRLDRLPAYVPESNRIVKNKVAWHILQG